MTRYRRPAEVSPAPFAVRRGDGENAGDGGHIGDRVAAQAAAAPGDFVINEVLYDPAGDLSGDANGDGVRDAAGDEFVEIVNVSGGDIDIGGWSLSDDDGDDFVFPSNTVVPNLGAVLLFGGGTPTGGFAGARVFTDDGTIGTGLGNGGDLVQLRDNGGTVIASVGYGSAGSDGTAADQSLVLSPDVTGVTYGAHGAIAPGGALFSPGTDVDGVAFAGGGPDETAPLLISTTPADDASGVVPTGALVLTFDERVTAGTGSITIRTVSPDALVADLDVAGADVSFGGASVTVTPPSTLPEEAELFVTVDPGAVEDLARNGFAGIADTTTFNFATGGPVTIGTIQGSPATQVPNAGVDDASPLLGQSVSVGGIVVGDYDGQATGDGDLGGFYLQDPAGDGDAATSDGVFVYTDGTGSDVSLGDGVTVTGTVTERFGQTAIDVTAGAFSIDSTGFDVTTLVTTVDFAATGTTANDNGGLIADLEAYEGMLVDFVQDVTVVANFRLDDFGEVVVSAAGPLVQYTQDTLPDVAGYAAAQAFSARNTFRVDDGFNGAPGAFTLPDGTLTGPDEFRAGDVSGDLVGVLGYDFDDYRVRPVDLDGNGNPFDDYSFANTNPRPATAPPVGGSFSVASFNLLNFFTTLDQSGVTTANGFDPRGADTAPEFARQLEKTVTAILGTGAALLGINEIENDFDEASNNGTEDAIAVLVDALNETLGVAAWDYVDPGTDLLGTDAIAVGFLYDSRILDLAEGTTPARLDDSVVATLPGFSGAPAIFDGPNTNRVPLAASFEHLGTGETFTAVVNHFKSKGGSGSGDDADIDDGQAAFNGTRVRGAEAVLAWLETHPTGSADPDVIVLGDLNAYAAEDPVRAFEAAGFVNTADSFDPDAYSYTFDGQRGTLDYGLASPTLFAQTTGAGEWHINADEPDAFDYNLEGALTGVFDGDDPFRSSDHDPLLVGFALGDDGLITGTEGDDTLIGTAGDDTLAGLDGSDRIEAGAGNDLLFGDQTSDGVGPFAVTAEPLETAAFG